MELTQSRAICFFVAKEVVKELGEQPSRRSMPRVEWGWRGVGDGGLYPYVYDKP